jgi:hypothetical protein
VNDIREGASPVRFKDGGAGVVAGGLDSQDHGVFIAFRLVSSPTRQQLPTMLTSRADILCTMRAFSLLFTFIALILLAQFLIYVVREPTDPFVAGGIFFSFLICLAPALYLLKPFGTAEDLRRRREARKERETRREDRDHSSSEDS